MVYNKIKTIFQKIIKFQYKRFKYWEGEMNKLIIKNNSNLYQLFSYVLSIVSVFQVAKATVFERNNYEFIDINPWSFTDF